VYVSDGENHTFTVAEATTAYNYLVRNDYVNDNGELTDIYRAVAESGSFPR
jgi:type III restriction enzyme